MTLMNNSFPVLVLRAAISTPIPNSSYTITSPPLNAMLYLSTSRQAFLYRRAINSDRSDRSRRTRTLPKQSS
jgi:hypothetical protein